MARSQESYSKKEKEKKRRKKQQDKVERREQRKVDKAEGGTASFEDMIAYVDEDGNLTSTPPDPSKKRKIRAEDIQIGVGPKDDTPFDPTRRGRVKFYNDEKGYGFIVDADTKDSIFVHASQVIGELRENDKVTFEIEHGPKGLTAARVKIMDPNS